MTPEDFLRFVLDNQNLIKMIAYAVATGMDPKQLHDVVHEAIVRISDERMKAELAKQG